MFIPTSLQHQHPLQGEGTATTQPLKLRVRMYTGCLLLRRHILYIPIFPSEGPECSLWPYASNYTRIFCHTLPCIYYSHTSLSYNSPNPMLTRPNAMMKQAKRKNLQSTQARSAAFCAEPPHSRYTTSQRHQQKNPASPSSPAE